MTKVERTVVCKGDEYEVACAVRADCVTSPVAEFLSALKEQTWAVVSDGVAPLSPDEQVKAHSWLLAAIEHFANHCEFPHVGDRNQLMQGIWEIKHWDLRVSFFDTDGEGNYSPKITERIHTGGGGYCPLPDFDDYVRLGTVFIKVTAKTRKHEIDSAIQVREEDLEHDRK